MITGDDFLEVAAEWAADARLNEAAWRSAISRAYYGAFHIARTFILDDLQQPVSRSKGDHAFVPQVLIASRQRQAVEAGVKLQRLSQDRNNADYEIGKSWCGEREKAIEACSVAALIRELIEQCRDQNTISAMRSHIANWRQVNKT